MDHHVIKLFEGRAELQEAQGSKWSVDDAISELAAWMDLARYKLTDDDMAVLVEIGGTLYREGMMRIASKRGNAP